ncbi:MAG: ABC transporter ATP-binding protein/permease [Oscillospiraceae bacterium]
MPPGRVPRGGYQKPQNLGKTLRRLIGYLTKNPLPLVLVFTCLLCSVGTNLAGTYMMRGIINDFIWSGCADYAGLTFGILKLIAVYLAGCLASYGQSAIMVRLAQRGVNRLRYDLFDKLQELPLSYFDRHPHGELMSRFTNDADNVQTALEQSMVSMVSSCLMFAGLVIMMLVINWKLFLVTAVILALTMTIFKTLGGKSRKYYQAQQAALGAVNGNIQEMIEGLKVVKAFTREERAKADFKALNETYRDAAQKANFYSTTIMPISGNLMNVSYALTACFGGVLAVLQGFDLGGMIIYLNLARQVGQPLNQISQQMTAVLSALAGAERIFAVMDAQPEVDEGKVRLVRVTEGADGSLTGLKKGDRSSRRWAWQEENGTLVPLKGDVRFENVDFAYVPGKRILHGISLYATPGQKIAFVGSTGAGKTTITNLINRFYELEGGRITYDGIDVRRIAKDDLRASLGMVLQDTHLFTGTVMDNIRYGRLDATDEECIAAAKTANAHSFIRRLPQGYQTVVTGDGANLSQGQRQLLAIARAAVADPPVMILDEATSSIDTRTEKHIEAGMDALMEGRTVFVIAHRLSTVRNSNCIVVIEQGQIEEKGDHDALLAEKGRYYSLYTGQFQLE